MSAEALGNKMEEIILKRVAADKLGLATIPESAEKCLQLLRDPNYSAKRATAVLERDPLLTARVLRVANSAAYGAGGLFRLDTAVTRLGTQKLRTLLLDVSARQVFISKDEQIARACLSIWQHSIAVALVARDLMALGAAGDADGAYLCGLLHDVGKPLVAVMLLETERSVIQNMGSGWIGSEDWVALVNRVHRKVGLALAEKWQLPPEVIAGIAESTEYDNSSRKSLSNYVRFANALVKREGFPAGPVDLDEISSLIMIGRSLLDIDDDVLGKLTATLKERVLATTL